MFPVISLGCDEAARSHSTEVLTGKKTQFPAMASNTALNVPAVPVGSVVPPDPPVPTSPAVNTDGANAKVPTIIDPSTQRAPGAAPRNVPSVGFHPPSAMADLMASEQRLATLFPNASNQQRQTEMNQMMAALNQTFVMRTEIGEMEANPRAEIAEPERRIEQRIEARIQQQPALAAPPVRSGSS